MLRRCAAVRAGEGLHPHCIQAATLCILQAAQEKAEREGRLRMTHHQRVGSCFDDRYFRLFNGTLYHFLHREDHGVHRQNEMEEGGGAGASRLTVEG